MRRLRAGHPFAGPRLLARRNPAAVERAVQQGADVNARDKYGRTSLHLAASNGNPEVVLAPHWLEP
ncbi:MAG: ankyrin repeat domain-containing protein [Deinococcota bacterium]